MYIIQYGVLIFIGFIVGVVTGKITAEKEWLSLCEDYKNDLRAALDGWKDANETNRRLLGGK